MTLAKREKLINAAQKILNDKKLSFKNDQLISHLGINKNDIIKAYIDYDLDIFSYNKEIYKGKITRFVMHMHNQLEGSWHIERQNIVEKFVTIANPNSIVDIGFGVPQQYLKNFLIKSCPSSLQRVSLVDIDAAAIEFASVLLNSWSLKWSECVELTNKDMTSLCDSSLDYDLFILQDSIELTTNPGQCLRNFIKNSKPTAQFLLSLPIGPSLPKNNISWKNIEEAENWLKKLNLFIKEYDTTSANPGVDLFAEQIQFNLTDYIVLCQKMI